MVAINIKMFGGMQPAVDNRLLPDTAAAHSENTWLYSGAFVGLPEPTFLRTNASAATTRVYRIPESYQNARYLFGDDVWLEFEDPNTDVIRAPVHNDAFDRYYWASRGISPRYNTRARIATNDVSFILGVPASGTAPGLSATGGTGTAVTRSYVTTWVTAYGEEGPPSPPVTLTGKQDDTWTVTLPSSTSAEVDRNLEKVRIYRTITSASGVATYFLVTEQPIATLTYDDTASDDTVSENSQLESTSWNPPPTDLEGFVVMPNGIIAGWRSNELWFSEPYRPHAWPAAYSLTVEYPIVGLGVTNQTLVVCTSGVPLTATGVHPAYIRDSKLANFEPCISRGSILSAPEGVYYSSPNGLILVSAARAENITRTLVTRDRWEELTSDTALRAARLGTAYFAFGTVQAGVYNEDAFEMTAFPEEDFAGARTGLLVDVADQRVAFNLLANDEATMWMSNDPWSGELFFVRDGDVYWLNIAEVDTNPGPGTWRSKVFQTNDKKNLGAMRVYFTTLDETPTLNPIRNTSSVQTLAADQYGLVRVYADGVLKFTRELRTSGELWKLPGGFKADYWQIEVEARVKVFSIQAASSAKELRSV